MCEVIRLSSLQEELITTLDISLFSCYLQGCSSDGKPCLTSREWLANPGSY